MDNRPNPSPNAGYTSDVYDMDRSLLLTWTVSQNFLLGKTRWTDVKGTRPHQHGGADKCLRTQGGCVIETT